MSELGTTGSLHKDTNATCEADRVAAVEALDLFADSTDSAYNDAVYLAALICNAPIGMVSILDGATQRFKAATGIDLCQTPQDESICQYTIRQTGLMVVHDTLLDSRFQRLPAVCGPLGIRFYAGIPLATPSGHVVGTLCVCDIVPRILNEDQMTALGILSRRVADRFQERQKVIHLKEIIDEKDRVTKELESASTLFQVFMDTSPLISYLGDEQGRLVYYNRAFADFFQITRDAWIGRTPFEIFPQDLAVKFTTTDAAITPTAGLVVCEVSFPSPQGEMLHWRTYKFAFVHATGERFLAGICHEMTAEIKAAKEIERYHSELRVANERLLELSLTDPLTGCRNRRAFDERLSQEAALCERHVGTLAVLMIDIDNFKIVNDTYGHEIGDKVLCHVAEKLQQGARASDVVCRYGGEEFAMLLPHATGADAYVIADRLRASIEELWEGCSVTVSIGIGISSSASNCNRVLRLADEALYDAKTSGKNRVKQGATA